MAQEKTYTINLDKDELRLLYTVFCEYVNDEDFKQMYFTDTDEERYSHISNKIFEQYKKSKE